MAKQKIVLIVLKSKHLKISDFSAFLKVEYSLRFKYKKTDLYIVLKKLKHIIYLFEE